MKCKPGDLALIIKPPLAGRLVEVLYAAPTCDHILPDGGYQVGTPPGYWVVKSLGSPFPLLEVSGPGPQLVRVAAMFGSCPDRYLSPLPGDHVDDGDTTTTERSTDVHR